MFLGLVAQASWTLERYESMAISISKLSKKRLGDWVINPYIGCEHGCLHCYCPAMPGVKFFNQGHGHRDWGNYLIPKTDWLERLRLDVKRYPRDGSIAGQGYVLCSFLTDCYTPSEAKHNLTRESLKILLDAGCKVRIQTRSALVERDFDILRQYREHVLLGTSLPYLDDKLARVLEPHATAPSRRLAMLRNARAEGLKIYVAIAPYMPFHSDEPLREVVGAVRDLELMEVFDEVLNPRSDNLGLMNQALERASRPERIAASYCESWPRFTYRHLRAAQAACEAAGIGEKFVAWPDPVAVRSKQLTEAERAWLAPWMPSEKEIKVPRQKRRETDVSSRKLYAIDYPS